MNIHISTSKSFRFDDMPPTKCPICEYKTMFSGWTGSDCDTCGVSLSEGIYQSDIVRTVREYSKLSRKEIAEKFGVKQSTIKSYEWKQPSKKYFDWFKLFIREFYKGNNESSRGNCISFKDEKNS